MAILNTTAMGTGSVLDTSGAGADDDTVAINGDMNTAVANGSALHFDGSKTYFVGGDLTVPAGCVIRTHGAKFVIGDRSSPTNAPRIDISDDSDEIDIDALNLVVGINNPSCVEVSSTAARIGEVSIEYPVFQEPESDENAALRHYAGEIGTVFVDNHHRPLRQVGVNKPSITKYVADRYKTGIAVDEDVHVNGSLENPEPGDGGYIGEARLISPKADDPLPGQNGLKYKNCSNHRIDFLEIGGANEHGIRFGGGGGQANTIGTATIRNTGYNAIKWRNAGGEKWTDCWIENAIIVDSNKQSGSITNQRQDMCIVIQDAERCGIGGVMIDNAAQPGNFYNCVLFSAAAHCIIGYLRSNRAPENAVVGFDLLNGNVTGNRLLGGQINEAGGGTSKYLVDYDYSTVDRKIRDCTVSCGASLSDAIVNLNKGSGSMFQTCYVDYQGLTPPALFAGNETVPNVVITSRVRGTTPPGLFIGNDALKIDSLNGDISVARHADLSDPSSELRVNGTRIVGAQKAAVSDASGGLTVDSEARAAINTLLSRLRDHGLIAS